MEIILHMKDVKGIYRLLIDYPNPKYQIDVMIIYSSKKGCAITFLNSLVPECKCFQDFKYVSQLHY